MRQYGIPYMGSKSKILKKLCAIFPKADNFYDIFGGGFSVSHFMLEHRGDDFNQFHYNEIRRGLPELIKNAIAGKYNYDVYKPEFITREMFFDRLETDPMVKIIWSFGNNGKGYIFGKDIEKQKESMHNAIIFNEFDDYAKWVFGTNSFSESYSIKDKRLYLKSRIKYHKLKRSDTQRLQQLERLERLQQLQQLQQLERLDKIVNFTNKDYREVEIKQKSIIYCDPPYIDTASYDEDFNHKEFYNWAASQQCPVFISEYTQPNDDRFKLISSFKKRSLINSIKSSANIKIEKIFGNKHAIDSLRGMYGTP